jgi:hypothetical protein
VVCLAPDATIAVGVRHGEQRGPDAGGYFFVSEFRLRHQSIPIGVETGEERSPFRGENDFK